MQDLSQLSDHLISSWDSLNTDHMTKVDMVETSRKFVPFESFKFECATSNVYIRTYTLLSIRLWESAPLLAEIWFTCESEHI